MHSPTGREWSDLQPFPKHKRYSDGRQHAVETSVLGGLSTYNAFPHEMSSPKLFLLRSHLLDKSVELNLLRPETRPKNLLERLFRRQNSSQRLPMPQGPRQGPRGREQVTTTLCSILNLDLAQLEFEPIPARSE